VLEELPTIQRMTDAPVRLPIIDKMKDMGTLVNGKLESGILSKGDPLILMPNKVRACGVDALVT
jgi:peptide chain release factor subunit 3